MWNPRLGVLYLEVPGASLPQSAELLGCSFDGVRRYAHLVSSDVADLARGRLAGVEF